MLSHSTLAVADHVHSLAVLTVTLAVPPLAGSGAGADSRVTEHFGSPEGPSAVSVDDPHAPAPTVAIATTATNPHTRRRTGRQSALMNPRAPGGNRPAWHTHFKKSASSSGLAAPGFTPQRMR